MPATPPDAVELRTARRSDEHPGLDFLDQVPFLDLYHRLVVHACTQLELALGPRHGRHAVAAVLQSLPHHIPADLPDAEALRRRVREGDLSILDEPDVEVDWQEIAAELAHLFIYARHGESRSLDPATSRVELEELLDHFRRLVADPGVRAVVAADFDWFADTLAAAEARWALDNGRPVAPDDLAALAGVKGKTLANLVAAGQIASDGDGRIPAAEALQYLDRRRDFIRSTWQEVAPPPPAALEGAGLPLAEQVFVPVDGEGGPFLPSLARRGRDGQPRYIVGEKAAPQYFEDYWEALAALARMPVPRWRRPPASGAGGWSLVTAQEGWRRYSRADLQRMLDAVGNTVAIR